MIKQTLIPPEEIELFKELPDIHVVVDVGARVDCDYTDIYPDLELHAFEPEPEFFAVLKEKIGDKPNVHLNNWGIGDMVEKRAYDPNTQSFMLPVGNQVLEIKRLDPYLIDNGITKIDFLKVDVEGYDLRVLAGNPYAVQISRFIQYEHWDLREPFHYLLAQWFDMEYVGYRNVLCMNRNLVPLTERLRIKKIIAERKYYELS